MAADECEIEYLDEDEELLQQCMQIVHTPLIARVENFGGSGSNDQLLVERKFDNSAGKKRIRTEEEDSDYDPNDNKVLLKKKKIIKKPQKKIIKIDSQQASLYVNRNESVQKPLKTYSRANVAQKLQAIQKKTTSKMIKVKELRPARPITKTSEELLKERKKLDIKIPNFEDPLCLPVRAVVMDNNELKKLKYWNNLCLSSLTKGNDGLQSQGKVVSSKRTVVLSNNRNRNDGLSHLHNY